MSIGAVSRKKPNRGYCFGDYTLDFNRAALIKGGATVHLRRQSFDVLRFLIERQGCLVSKEELLAAIWGNTHVTDDSLTHCLIDIRKAIGDSQHELIRTVPRRGFIFDMPAHALERQNLRAFSYVAIAACLAVAVVVVLLIATGSRSENEAGPASVNMLVDSDAKDLYRQARFLFNRRANGDMEAARRYYLGATEIEPGYADAWAGAAATYYIDFLGDRRDTSKLAKIKTFAENAISIDPGHAEGHFRLSMYYRLSGDGEAAERHMQTAFSVETTDPLMLTIRAGIHEQQGEIDLAIDLSYQAVASDPLSLIYRKNLAWYLLAAGRDEEALEQSTRVSALSSGSVDNVELVTGLALIKLGRHLEALDAATEWPHLAAKYQVLAMANFGLGREPQARGAIVLLKTFSESEAYLRLAELQAHCDEIDLSFKTLTAMRELLIIDRQTGKLDRQIRSVERSPFMANIRTDSRWAPWLAETREMTSEDLVLSFR